MNNINLIRDKEGIWWITNSRNKPVVKFAYSDETEYAYNLGIEKGRSEPSDAISAVLKSKPEL